MALAGASYYDWIGKNISLFPSHNIWKEYLLELHCPTFGTYSEKPRQCLNRIPYQQIFMCYEDASVMFYIFQEMLSVFLLSLFILPLFLLPAYLSTEMWHYLL